ncbi:MAG: hypothetical protein APG12_00130 [Candidatus Methanofastidiosum methylothiophilum]|uniref:Uncharacterized protein n=1 Tax=Candidatus Methanofastidiosum methylothiophilum TaxID=1705564 RepID=A0A150IQ69_9EURY|nr:MAG: hypothetical protein APG10_00828 [Candidatus Methanofastidiosum methylthiophilus]KYC47191.1 MAG: hypothetical protein APG11_01347 [Candidatus Methanofastidiosum methylthiophilus]KYC51466.1 MAG: hypothetical protein APG12_00130 [Candidatus Methanofastidiosum methylthiophilus]
MSNLKKLSGKEIIKILSKMGLSKKDRLAVTLF